MTESYPWLVQMIKDGIIKRASAIGSLIPGVRMQSKEDMSAEEKER